MPQRVNIDYSAFSNAQSQLNSFFNKDLLTNRAQINKELIRDEKKKKKTSDMVDAGLLIASMFVAPGVSAVNEANAIAAVGAKEVVKKTGKEVIKAGTKKAVTTNANKEVAQKLISNEVKQIVTNPLKKGFFAGTNLKAYGKEFAKGALRKNSPSDMFTMTLSNGESKNIPRAFLKGIEYIPEDMRESFFKSISNNFGISETTKKKNLFDTVDNRWKGL